MDVSSFSRGFLFFLALIFSNIAFAYQNDSYLYQNEYLRFAQSYLSLLQDLPTDRLSSLPADKQATCTQRYNGILKDGVIDIRVALGYFDWTTGSAVGSYGLSPSIDLGAYASLRDTLTDRCHGNLRFCGFKSDSRNPYVFTRTVSLFGKTYPVRLEMHFSSATEFFAANTGQYSSQQQQRTQFMDSFFANALQNSDATFYFGHSRNGGGPDFAPPRLMKNNKVDYKGYYEVVRPGFKKVMAALSNPDKQTPIFGLMSCDSRDHFAGPLRKLAPHTGIITSTAVLNLDQVYTAMIGAIDAILRGQCQQGFYKELRMTPGNQEHITMDGMFE